jgi:hypothetical protein
MKPVPTCASGRTSTRAGKAAAWYDGIDLAGADRVVTVQIENARTRKHPIQTANGILLDRLLETSLQEVK